MKSVVQSVILSGSLTLMSAMLTPVLAVTIGTQDFIIFESIKIDTGNGITDISPELISTALGSPKESVIFPGGGVFTSTDKFPGLATNENLVISDNTNVTTGIYSFDGNTYLASLISSDISKTPRNFGLSDLIQFDIASAFPNLKVGETGTLNALNFLFTIPSDTSEETGLTPLEVAVSRTKKGKLVSISQDNSTLLQVYNLPFTIAEGNSFTVVQTNPFTSQTNSFISNGSPMRLFGKGLMIVGDTILGAVGGAAVGGFFVPAVGAIPGSLAGGAGGLLASAGNAIVEDTKDAPETPKEPPTTPLQPPSSRAILTPKAVPEPLTMLGAATAVGFGASFKRRLAKVTKENKNS
jgi:hypothetical protein